MTRETKLGLLVGLAFIVLFALIISEGGSSGRSIRPANFQVADGNDGANADNDRPSDAESFEGRLAVDDPVLIPDALAKARPTSNDAPTDAPAEALRLADSQSRRDLPVVPLHGATNSPGDGGDAMHAADTARPGVLSAEMTPLVTADATDSAPTVIPSPVDATRAGERAQAESRDRRLPSPSKAQAGVKQRRDNAKEPSGGTRLAHSQAARQPGPADSAAPDGRERRASGDERPLEILVYYTVLPGDSLSRIAAKHYGRSTPKSIDAIFDANPHVLKDLNRIRVGQKIVVPRLETKAPALARAVGPTERNVGPVRIPRSLESGRRSKDGVEPIKNRNAANRPAKKKTNTPARKKTPDSGRTYVVRKNDSLSRIAMRELGSAGRYHEIFEINRDRLKNPNVVIPGTKLRLPSKTSAGDGRAATPASQGA
ncbi:MAG: LysM peptidoglycan-binding domain-containing protein [Phycisphaerae bacterium]